MPPSVLVTNLRPDLFLVNEAAGIAILLELTCPWDGNITRSHEFKREKYSPLVGDDSRQLNAFLFSYRGLSSGTDFEGESRAAQGLRVSMLLRSAEGASDYSDGLIQGVTA